MGRQEKHFWLRHDIELGKALELGASSPDNLMEDMGWWVRLGLVPLVAQEGPLLTALRKMELKLKDAGSMVA